MRNLWNAIGALLLAALLIVACEGAQAQTVCRHWTDGFGLNMEGTPTQGCDAAAANFATVYPDRTPVTVTSCVYASSTLTVGVQLSSPADTGTLTVTDSGACTGEPDPEEPPAEQVIRAELILPDFLNLSVPDGLSISGAICGIWALAWALRAVIRSLASDGDSSNPD